MLRVTVLLVLLATGALHLLGATVLRDSFWGVHHYAFLPAGWLVAATSLLLASGWLLLPRAAGRLAPAWERLPASAPAGWRKLAAAAALGLAGGLLFWLARAGHVILGDGSVAVVNVAHPEPIAPREPLTGLLQKAVYTVGKDLFAAPGRAPEEIAQRGLALGSVLAGALFLPVAWALAGELARLARAAPPRPGAEGAAAAPAGAPGRLAVPLTGLLFLLLLAQGYAQLFFGYVENYTWVTLAMGLYLWLALRAVRGGGTLVWPGGALGLAIALHMSAAVFLPSFLVLLAARFAAGRALPALRDLAACALLAAGVAAALRWIGGGYDLLGALLEVTRLALLDRGDAPGYLLSAAHLRDFLNEQLLIGPLALFLFLPGLAAAAVAFRRGGRGAPASSRRVAVLFLAAAGLAYAGVSWVAGESNLGYPRNWDLLAPAGLAFTAGGLGLFLAAGVDARRAAPVLLCALVISLYHTAPWIAVNTSFERGFARLKTLPGSGGITEANVGRWYLLRGDREQARAWLRRALAVNPANNNAHYLLGMMAMDEGRYREAADAYGRALAALPEKDEYRRALAEALVAAGEYREAIGHCTQLLARAPEDPQALVLGALAMTGEGLPEALPVLEHVRTAVGPDSVACAAIRRAIRARADAALAAGRWAEAMAFYDEAFAWSDDVPGLALAVAPGLLRAGRGLDARVVLELGLRHDPSPSQRERILSLLASPATATAPAGPD